MGSYTGVDSVGQSVCQLEEARRNWKFAFFRKHKEADFTLKSLTEDAHFFSKLTTQYEDYRKVSLVVPGSRYPNDTFTTAEIEDRPDRPSDGNFVNETHSYLNGDTATAEDCGCREGRETCPNCGASREVTCPDCSSHRSGKCGNCAGTGRVTHKQCGGSGRCQSCKGRGTLRCSGCGGSGLVTSSERYATSCATCRGTGRVSSPNSYSNTSGYSNTRSYSKTMNPCSHCGGTGTVWANRDVRVPDMRCNGSGLVTCTTCGRSGSCPGCGGTGKVICQSCGGTGICRSCSGQGVKICPTCGGRGEISLSPM